MTQRLLAVIGGAVLLIAGVTGMGTVWLEQQMTRPLVVHSSTKTSDEMTVFAEFESDVELAEAFNILMFYGVVEEPLLWRLRSRQRAVNGQVIAGRYRLDLQMSPDEIVDRLLQPPDAVSGPLRLQIIPGDTIWRVRSRISELGIDTDLLTLDRDVKAVGKLGCRIPTRTAKAFTRLEGYLAPDTYYLDRDEPTVFDAVQAATRQHTKRWKGLVRKHRASYERLRKRFRMTDHDFLTLASLVEKEVAYLPEAPMIAAVFYNRLVKKMKLQTDPTMVYSPSTWREKPSPEFRRDTRNPYNTYAHSGLPPGPICSPGPRALEAVLMPAKTNALFFVAKRDGEGRHVFAESLDEHRANIRRYLKRK